MSVSTVYVSVLLSVVCLGVVFVGGWYLHFSLMELNTQVMEQHFYNQEQTKQIEELNKKNYQTKRSDHSTTLTTSTTKHHHKCLTQ